MAAVGVIARQTSARDRDLSRHWDDPQDAVTALNACTVSWPEPGDNSQKVIGEGGPDILNGMLPRHEYAAKLPRPLQRKAEEMRVIDSGLLDVVHIRGIVRMAQCINIAVSYADKRLETCGITGSRIGRERAHNRALDTRCSCDEPPGRSTTSAARVKMRRRIATVEA